ncbi:hypothetical protein RO3G_14850 [Rhizopus delemar RA 99-880]|uniref:Uncharacterized protein n=1 Tax=Rhizopus delemar (strain RA 99-880 / ATCC MYA-4621 / FGSC 9543 / NRRL 43880) TaxID=246409 RepID=I1CNV9_RHIO9|nr:hypothetical protein RO3G_14850 [Rhizopus delemar RA 99-880]|eukprot:EIE90139.1 hypothetical protein RO3G_14850 [Rhizopus delemar RA 99-880]
MYEVLLLQKTKKGNMQYSYKFLDDALKLYEVTPLVERISPKSKRRKQSVMGSVLKKQMTIQKEDLKKYAQ